MFSLILRYIFLNMAGIIEIEGMEFYAYHGCFKEEQIVGNRFIADVFMETNCDAAAASDNLKDALNYQVVYNIIQEQMAVKSHLLENVCQRILDGLFAQFKQLEYARIKVSKINPPMGGQIEKVSVTLSRRV